MTDRLLTDDELRAIEERRAAAPTPPWSYGYEDDGPHCLLGNAGLLWGRITDCPGRPALATAAFLAHASADIPRLLAEVRELRLLLRDAVQDSTPGNRLWREGVKAGLEAAAKKVAGMDVCHYEESDEYMAATGTQEAAQYLILALDPATILPAP